ncbi:MAG: hypothetical protein ACT4PE_08845 [Candidatus Eiseniibacteriota bacterium]
MTFRRSLLLVFAVGVVYLACMLRATGGRPSLPLDDSFIYFQYARQAAAGQPFVYQPGEAPTTGTTSLPWMILLGLGSLLGFDGKAMIFFAMILGGVALAACVRFAGAAGAGLAGTAGEGAPPGPRVMPLAAILVLLSGPLHWGAWSGMEIAYFSATVAWAFAELVRSGGRPAARAALAAATMATARPEGALLAVALAALWVARALLDREARAGLAWAALPFAASLVQPLVNLALTGDARSSGLLAKTLFSVPGATLLDVLRVALLRAASLAAALFGGLAPFADGRGLYAYESEGAALWVPPGAGILFLIGVLPEAAREWRERKPATALVALTWVAALLVSTAALEEPDAHFSRYQMPILPVFLIWTAVGVRRIGEPIAAGARGWLVATASVSVVFFAAAFGDNCQDIDRMQICFGETIAETLPPDAVVAINDAGAIAYFSGRRTLDLIGLTTPGMAGLWPQGSGVLWESLEARPPRDRPGWFCFFPNWFEFDDLGVIRRIGSVRLLAPSIVDAEKVLATFDWTLAGSGDRPRLGGPAARLVDRVDVADPASERAHRFTWRNGERGADAGSFVRRATFAGVVGDEIIDAGRSVFGEVQFDLARDPMSPVNVVARTPGGIRQRTLVSVDGGAEQPVEIYGPGGGFFHEQQVAAIPPGRGAARVRIRLVEEAAGSAPLVLTHVFALAGAEE